MTVERSERLFSRAGWRSLAPAARQLIAARFLRSIAQGALGVDFTLYLRAGGWTAPQIGLLLMAGGLAGAALSVWVGTASDRVGRRTFLLLYEAGLVVGTLAVLMDPEPWILVVTAAVFGFGRGANGASGPFAPAEQAWLAQSVPGSRRGAVFSFNAALQFWGMGIGSGLAAVLPHLLPGSVGPAAYAPVFALNLVIAAINYVQIYSIVERRPGGDPDRAQVELKPQSDAAQSDPPQPNGTSRDPLPLSSASLDDHPVTRSRQEENKAMASLMLINMLNSLGVGLVAPLLPYWFALRFGVGPEAIGPVFGLTFLLTGLSSLAVGKMTERVGLTKSIVWPRLIGVATMIAMPFMPTFWLAAVLYVVRSIVNRGSLGARQAFSVGLVRDERRGLASSLNAVSWNVPAAFGPAIGGWLLGMGSLFWPFALASVFQLAYAVLFSTVMGKYEPARVSAVRQA